MQTTERTKLSVALETTHGETSANPAHQLPVTKSSLAPSKETVQSATLRPDRTVDDLIEVGAGAGGTTDLEVANTPALQLLLEGALCNDWKSANCNATLGAHTVQVTPETLAIFALAGLVKITGAATPANNGVYRVTGVDTETNTLTIDGDLTPGNGNAACKYIVNGTKNKSYTVEQSFEDISKYQLFTGMKVDTMSLDLKPKAILTGTLNFKGKKGLPLTNAENLAPTAPATAHKLSASANVGALYSEGAQLASKVTGLTLAIANNLRDRPVVGDKYSLEHGVGQFAVTGNLGTFFNGQDLYNKFLAHLPTDLQIPLVDAAGVNYLITLPKLQLSTGPVTIGGINQDVTAEYGYTALSNGKFALRIDII